jgi:hypothetical protein
LDVKGQLADPITLYVHGTLPQLIAALTKDGWTRADAATPGKDAKYAGAAIADEALKEGGKVDQQVDHVQATLDARLGHKVRPLLPQQPKGTATVNKLVNEMPVSPQTYLGHPIADAFERNNDPLGGRDHLRIFDTGRRDDAGRQVFAIAASRDSGIRPAPDHPETLFMFHAVQPDVSGEREDVLKSLTGSGAKLLGEPLKLAWSGTSVYGELVSDGKGYDVALP